MPLPALTRHVEDAFPELGHLFEAGQQVASLREHPGWAHVQTVLARELDAISARLDHANEPPSQAVYALAHGRRGGLLALKEAADAIVERADKRYAEQKAKHEGAAESAQEG
jgi:hypothetical protein